MVQSFYHLCPVSVCLMALLREPGHVLDMEPPAGSLADKLEGDEAIRRSILHPRKTEDEQILTAWPCKNTIGVKSVKAMALNGHLLTVVAKWWTFYHETCTSLTIDIMRREAG